MQTGSKVLCGFLQDPNFDRNQWMWLRISSILEELSVQQALKNQMSLRIWFSASAVFHQVEIIRSLFPFHCKESSLPSSPQSFDCMFPWSFCFPFSRTPLNCVCPILFDPVPLYRETENDVITKLWCPRVVLRWLWKAKAIFLELPPFYPLTTTSLLLASLSTFSRAIPNQVQLLFWRIDQLTKFARTNLST